MQESYRHATERALFNRLRFGHWEDASHPKAREIVRLTSTAPLIVAVSSPIARVMVSLSNTPVLTSSVCSNM
jgi:hypothetical protein